MVTRPVSGGGAGSAWLTWARKKAVLWRWPALRLVRPLLRVATNQVMERALAKDAIQLPDQPLVANSSKVSPVKTMRQSGVWAVDVAWLVSGTIF